MKWALLILIVLASLGAGNQSRPAPRPTTQVAMESCVTSECHAIVKSAVVVHGPIAVNACDACHELIDAERHAFKLARDGENLCTYCHEFSVADEPVVHKPVKTGECIGCHDPHGGRDATLTREESMPELCGRCHERITRDRHYLHTPVKQGACDSCHSPHASRFANLLDVRGADLCMTCHANFEAQLVRTRSIHKAVNEGCEKCHDPHGSLSPGSTTQPVKQLCANCHEQIAARAVHAAAKHTPVTDDRACMNCHTPHGSDHDALMSNVPAQVCLSCHTDSIKTGDGRVIASLKDVENPDLVRHGSIGQGQCEGCHDSHGADHPSLLRKVMARAFYERFAESKYELCMSCHDARMVRDERITGVTNFRDGDRNLHYVHVSVGKRSHSCFVCHESHVGPNPRLLRDRTQFGIWPLPMNFRMSETGGTCAPGCHVPYGYDRVSPVGPATLPASVTKLPIVRRDPDQPTTMRFRTSDITGREVDVPSQRTSIVLFCGSEDVVRDLGETRADQRWIVVCGGADAGALAHRIAERFDVIAVADSNHELANKFNVAGWPTAFVVDADGTIVTRLSGSLRLLAMKGRPLVVAGESRTVASRNLQIAEKLLEDGRAADARVVLARAIELEPDSTALRVTMIKCLIELNEARDAMSRLREIPEPDLQPGNREVLASQIFQRAGKWDQAITYARRAVELNPTSAEAHIQLGRVLEHEGNLKEALEEYRTGTELFRRSQPSRP